MLKQYDEIVPGLAQTIVSQFEEQGRHRRWAERFHLTWTTARSWAGLAFGFIVAMFGLWIAKEIGGVAGAVIAAIDLVALVAVFVYGSLTSRQERQEKVAAISERKSN